MDGLSPDLIRELLNKKRHRNSPRKFALVRTANGVEKFPVSKVKAEALGKFDGKAGTIKRSRKGRTYRKADGSRYYCPDWNNTVIGYTAGT